MIKNFDEIKAQLEQLAPVINSFQSEAVQMRIVDLILGGGAIDTISDMPDEMDTADPPATRRRSPRRRRRAVRGDGEEATQKGRTSSGKPSASATLERLIAEGFFTVPRGLGEIVSHCAETLALQYKNSDFSPILVRAVRDEKLKRTKNESGQFVYERI